MKPIFFKETLFLIILAGYINWERGFSLIDKKIVIREILISIYQLLPVLGFVLLIALLTVVKISCSWLGPLKSQTHE